MYFKENLMLKRFTADYFFNGSQLLKEPYVLVMDDKGKVLAFRKRKTEDETDDEIQQYKGILMPGFINCHCHLELSHMKDQIKEGTGLVNFVRQVMNSRVDIPYEERMHQMKTAELSMFRNGIVAVGDICNSDESMEIKKDSRLYYHNFIEISGWDEKIALSRMKRGMEILEKFRSAGFEKQSSIAPHAPYSISQKLWEYLQTTFPGNITSMHNQETMEENKLFREGGGDFLKLYQEMGLGENLIPAADSSLKISLPFLKKAASVLLVHNTYTNEEDILELNKYFNKRNLFICLCPSANLYIEGRLPDVRLLKKSGYSIVLGTDSLSSNHELNLLREIQILLKQFPELDTSELLQWATHNGAEALKITQDFGSFTPGAHPGLILLEDTPNGKITKNTTVRNLLCF